MNIDQGEWAGCPEPCPDGRRGGSRDGVLAELLGRAAGGDVAAFLAFYEQTSTITFRYALACRRGDRDSAVSLARSLYLEAWRTAAQHPASGLSPLAWLIAGGHRCDRQDPTTTYTEHAC